MDHGIIQNTLIQKKEHQSLSVTIEVQLCMMRLQCRFRRSGLNTIFLLTHWVEAITCDVTTLIFPNMGLGKYSPQ